jgi:protein-S-isoprenylcysteine O-methyltransferase Ste14
MAAVVEVSRSPIGFFIPLIWIVSPAFSFTEYPLRSGPLVVGLTCLAIGLWLFFRSHADLGTNWSVTLELRQEHRLVTQGVYRAIRHPMYSALIFYSVGQALVIPNWVAGFSNVIALAVLLALRLGAEEKMMAEQFGDEYGVLGTDEAVCSRRLVDNQRRSRAHYRSYSSCRRTQ